MARRHRPWVRPAPAWLGCGWLRELLSGMASGLHHALPACLHTPSVAFPTCQYVGATFPCLGSAMVGLQYFDEHSAVAGAESKEDLLCCVLGCSTRWHPGLLSAERPKTPSGRTAPHAPVIFFCGEGDKVRASASCGAQYSSSRRPPPGLHPLYQWQLCKTCNSQLYNITASGNNKRTTEFTDELRAQLGGSEYPLSTVAPRLGTPSSGLS